MKARMNIERPDDVEVTLTITMSAKHWRDLREQLQSNWPSWQLSSVIRRSLTEIEKTILHEKDVSP